MASLTKSHTCQLVSGEAVHRPYSVDSICSNFVNVSIVAINCPYLVVDDFIDSNVIIYIAPTLPSSVLYVLQGVSRNIRRWVHNVK